MYCELKSKQINGFSVIGLMYESKIKIILTAITDWRAKKRRVNRMKKDNSQLDLPYFCQTSPATCQGTPPLSKIFPQLASCLISSSNFSTLRRRFSFGLNERLILLANGGRFSLLQKGSYPNGISIPPWSIWFAAFSLLSALDSIETASSW